MKHKLSKFPPKPKVKFPFISAREDRDVFIVTGFALNGRTYAGVCIAKGTEANSLFQVGETTTDLSPENVKPFNGAVTIIND